MGVSLVLMYQPGNPPKVHGLCCVQQKVGKQPARSTMIYLLIVTLISSQVLALSSRAYMHLVVWTLTNKRWRRCYSVISYRLPPVMLWTHQGSESLALQLPLRQQRFVKPPYSQGIRTYGSRSLIMDQGAQGELNWRLSSHPITLLVFLGIRIG